MPTPRVTGSTPWPLRSLEGDERTRAEEMLLQYLPDTRGVIGLGVLGSRKAERRLAQLLDDVVQRELQVVYLGEGALANPARPALARGRHGGACIRR